MRTFLETTHERYEKAVGDQFGITVHGMFSDEVGLLSPIPWSKLLPEEFEKRNGYSLLDCMPALHDDSFENAMKVRYDLYETAHILFRTSYHKQVSDWCREHHLQYATEVPSMRHSTQRYSDIVGGIRPMRNWVNLWNGFMMNIFIIIGVMPRQSALWQDNWGKSMR